MYWRVRLSNNEPNLTFPDGRRGIVVVKAKSRYEAFRAAARRIPKGWVCDDADELGPLWEKQPRSNP